MISSAHNPTIGPYTHKSSKPSGCHKTGSISHFYAPKFCGALSQALVVGGESYGSSPHRSQLRECVYVGASSRPAPQHGARATMATENMLCSSRVYPSALSLNVSNRHSGQKHGAKDSRRRNSAPCVVPWPRGRLLLVCDSCASSRFPCRSASLPHHLIFSPCLWLCVCTLRSPSHQFYCRVSGF